jgi:uroporphyrinogen-III synthase
MEGKRIVITRAVQQAGELRSLLQQRGARVLLYPCIAVVAPADPAPLDRALQDLAAGAFDWLILTSANAAMVMAQRLQILGLLPPRRVALACVGPATAQAAQSLLGMQTRVLPRTYLAEALLPALRPLLPARLLLLQAEQARPVLREELAAAGATITAIVAYRTVAGEGGVHLSTLLKNRQVDAITFTSASTVRNCLARLRAEGAEPSLLAAVCLACIGPLTAQALRALNLAVSVLPGEQTIEALVEDLEAYFRVRCAQHAPQA